MPSNSYNSTDTRSNDSLENLTPPAEKRIKRAYKKRNKVTAPHVLQQQVQKPTVNSNDEVSFVSLYILVSFIMTEDMGCHSEGSCQYLPN